MTHPFALLSARNAAVLSLAIAIFLPLSASAQSANRPPVISGAPPTSAQPGQAYSFRPTASDPDGHRLTYHIQNRPGWASFDRNTGRLWGTPRTRNIGQFRNIRISVGDGRSSRALAPFTISVGQAQAGTRPNTAPTISGNPPTTVQEGAAYYFRPSAADRDGNRLTFAIGNRPPWATFNTANGTLSGTPGNGTAGNYANVTIRVSDGRLTATLQPFAIAVNPGSSGGGGNGSVTLSWTAPTTRTNGTPLTNLAGFRIRYGTSAGNQPNVVEVRGAGLTSAEVTELAPATYFFSVCAVDGAGVTSAYTAPVSTTIR